MIGVTMWSNCAKLKAVIWCDDHAALAYLHGMDALAEGSDFPQVGDLVELVAEHRNGLRFACQVRIISGQSRTNLPDILQEISVRENAQTAPVLHVVSSQRVEPKPVDAMVVQRRGGAAAIG